MLTLKEIYETKGVSFAKDKSVTKKQVMEGDGYHMPKDGCKATLKTDATGSCN